MAQRAGPITWAAAGAVSLTLFYLVLAQLDTSVLATTADNVSLMLIGIGVILFTTESLFFSTLRMHMIADSRRGMFTAMQRAYGWNLATAVSCAGIQRMLDITVLSTCLFLTMLAVFDLHENRLAAFFLLAGILSLLGLIGSATLHVWLRLLRHLNQAWHWLRSVRHRYVLRRRLFPTTISWAAMMTAYWILGRAVGLHITLAESSFAAASDSLVEALPVQSTGGVRRKQALPVSSHALAGRHGDPDHPFAPGYDWSVLADNRKSHCHVAT